MRWLSYLFQKFSKRRVRNEKKPSIRRVIFGIRPRLIVGFSMMFLIVTLTFLGVTYFHQYNLLFAEKTKEIGKLVKLLGSIAEILLEKNLMDTKVEVENKIRFVDSNIKSFLELNDDVFQIILTDKRYRIVLSRGEKVISQRQIDRIVSKGLQISNYTIFKTNISQETTNVYECKLIVLPIYQVSGLLISVNEDFDKTFEKVYLQGVSSREKEKILEALKNKYREFVDFKDVNTVEEMFLSLYTYLYQRNSLEINKGYKYLLSKSWLEAENKKIEKGIKETNLTLVKESYENIYKNLLKLREFGEGSKFLGYTIVVLNVTNLVRSINSNLLNLVVIFLVIYALSVLIIFYVSRVYVENIKKLEKWGLEVSNGNLSARVEISSKDEIGRLSDVFNYMLEELISRYHLEKFVSKGTISVIKDKRDKEISLGEVGRKNLAFLFSDVRGFTSFSEKNPPEEVVKILNTYLSLQSQVVKKYKGDIDDFVGDQIMAHFGGEKRADTAIKAAIEIVRKVSNLNEERKKQGLPTFEIGIGLHIGDVVVGTIGSEFRMDFACVGDVVNTCSRLCSIAQPMEIIASKDIVEASSKNFKYEELPPITIKGKEKPFEICRILP